MRTLVLVAAITVTAPWSGAQDGAPNLYRDQIQPLFQKSCLPCHNAGAKQGGLDLSTREAMLRGSEHGPVISPGKPDESQLYKVVAHVTKPEMPFQGKKLPDADIARIAEWIKSGAEYGGDSEGIDLTEVRKHWAFRSPARLPVPAPGNPIDAFLEAERVKRGLTALPQANQATLLRRVYIDLTGLPPTPEQVAAFTASKDPNAYGKIVDELLEGPGYGERWGRHWLDIGTDTARAIRSATRSGTSGAGATGLSNR